MVVDVASAGGGFLLETAARGDVDLATDDGLDLVLFCGLIELDGAVHDAVIGHRDRRKLVFDGLGHELVEPAARIEQGILGVQVQVDEIARHAGE